MGASSFSVIHIRYFVIYSIYSYQTNSEERDNFNYKHRLRTKSPPFSFPQPCVTAQWTSSSATTPCASPSPGSATARTTAGTTRTRTRRSAVSAVQLRGPRPSFLSDSDLLLISSASVRPSREVPVPPYQGLPLPERPRVPAAVQEMRRRQQLRRRLG